MVGGGSMVNGCLYSPLVGSIDPPGEARGQDHSITLEALKDKQALRSTAAKCALGVQLTDFTNYLQEASGWILGYNGTTWGVKSFATGSRFDEINSIDCWKNVDCLLHRTFSVSKPDTWAVKKTHPQTAYFPTDK